MQLWVRVRLSGPSVFRRVTQRRLPALSTIFISFGQEKKKKSLIAISRYIGPPPLARDLADERWLYGGTRNPAEERAEKGFNAKKKKRAELS